MSSLSQGRDDHLCADGALPVLTAGGYPSVLTPGQTYATWYPFKRSTWFKFEEEGGYELPTWAPGWNAEIGGREGERVDYGWDGDGAMLLTVVSLHKPGPTYPERAFYVRQWRDPDGRVFGKRNLRVVSARSVIEWLRGGKVRHLGLSDGEGRVPSSNAVARQAPGIAQDTTPNPNQGSEE